MNASANPRTATPTLLRELHDEVLRCLGEDARDLHIERAVLGIFFTGVKLDNGCGGLCATPVKSVPEAVCCPSSARAMPIPGRVRGRSAVQMLDDLYRAQDLRRAMAIAVLNALVETLWRRDGVPGSALDGDEDAFNAIGLKADEHVALVGAFPPYMRRLRKSGQRFHVLEMDPGTLKPEELPYYQPADLAPHIVPQADVLVTTGTTLVNDTIDGLLELLRPGARAAIIGPTTTLVPGPYARRGVTVMGGTRVRDIDELLEILAEGGSGYHFFGKTVQRVTLHVPLSQPLTSECA